MMHKQEINQIASVKTRLSRLQTQSNSFKNSFFDYIEGLESEYNVFSNYNRTDFSFEIYGNKLRLKATYNSQDTPFKGIFSAVMLKIENAKETYIDVLSWKFDTSGNFINSDGSYAYTSYDFAESFYIELMNKLIESDNFEL